MFLWLIVWRDPWGSDHHREEDSTMKANNTIIEMNDMDTLRKEQNNLWAFIMQKGYYVVEIISTFWSGMEISCNYLIFKYDPWVVNESFQVLEEAA